MKRVCTIIAEFTTADIPDLRKMVFQDFHVDQTILCNNYLQVLLNQYFRSTLLEIRRLISIEIFIVVSLSLNLANFLGFMF